MNMSKEMLNEVWKILRDDRLEFDVTCNNDVLCIICKKVLINAHNSPCGCRYCLDCITNYLNGEDKICPGNTNDCKEELLNINHNIHVDHPMNREILKLVVKCPEKSCEFKSELRNIGDHMRICDSRLVDCPYLNIGCKCSNTIVTSLKKHLLIEIVSHTKMLFELIDNLRNDIQILKEDNVELKKDNENLKKSINDLQSTYENANKEIEENLKEIENKFDVERRETITKLDEINRIITDLKCKSDCGENRMTVIEKNQEQHIGGEFVWCIDKWREKTEYARAGINATIYSDAFYSHRNGYKMCLSLYPNGDGGGKGTHLSIFFYLLRGEFDNILSWPFKYDVTFELINQHTTQGHVCLIEKYNSDPNMSRAFQKPTTDRNIGYGNFKFISLEELSNNLSLFDNDKLYIRCRVLKID